MHFTKCSQPVPCMKKEKEVTPKHCPKSVKVNGYTNFTHSSFLSAALNSVDGPWL
jgi:hypothetical protein